jgi:hypothetical protein
MSTTSIIAGDSEFATRDRVFDCPYCGARFIGHSNDTGFTLASLSEQEELGITAKITCPTCSNTAVATRGSKGEVQTVKELIILTLPTKTTYKPGDKFSTTGLVLAVRNSDGSIGAVELSDCTFSPSTSTDLAATDKKVTATHTASSKTVDIPIYVTNEQVRRPVATKTSYTYTGNAIALEVTGFDTNKMTRSNYSKTNAGDYEASYTPKTGYCWEDGTTDTYKIAWEITKATPTVTVSPVTNLTYTGEAQNLVTGSTTGGTLKYKLGSGGSYGTSIPTATNSGNYKVYYKVDGGSNYEDVPEQSLYLTMKKATPDAPTLSADTLSLTAIATPGTITVTRDGDGAVTAASSDTSVCTVAVEGTTVTVTAVADGEATVTVSVAAGQNYEAPTTQPECAVTVALE